MNDNPVEVHSHLPQVTDMLDGNRNLYSACVYIYIYSASILFACEICTVWWRERLGPKISLYLLEPTVSWGLLVDRALLFLEKPFDFWLCNLLITVTVKVYQPSSKRETH
jgi:hypothetical protein